MECCLPGCDHTAKVRCLRSLCKGEVCQSCFLNSLLGVQHDSRCPSDPELLWKCPLCRSTVVCDNDALDADGASVLKDCIVERGFPVKVSDIEDTEDAVCILCPRTSRDGCSVQIFLPQ